MVGCSNNESIIVTFNTLGGDSIESIELTDLDRIIYPTPTRVGYQFGGWYLDEDLTIPLSELHTVTQSFTLYAKWVVESINPVISFNTHGGSLIEAITYDGTINLVQPVDPIKEGYSFNGWYLDEALTILYTWQAKPQTSYVLHASWTINMYTIYFITYGGSTVDNLQVAYQTPLNLSNLTEKDGYTFEGWYIDNDFIEPFVDDKMPAHDVILHAKWFSHLITITFDAMGGSPINPVLGSTDESIVWPNNPVKEGYVFCGWYMHIDDHFPYDGTVFPNTSFVLYAKWATEGLVYNILNDGLSYEVGIGEDFSLVEIIIPSMYEGLPITKIMDQGFAYVELMTSITIPHSITHIGHRAFMYASSLTTIILPSNLQSIGNAVFRFCYELETIVIDESNPQFINVEGILFNKDMTRLIRYPQAKTLTQYSIPNSVTIIEEDAFSDADNLISLDLGTGVNYIKTHAFFRMSSLKHIDIPHQVTTIELYAFRECSALETITLGSGISEIPSYFCDSCISLKAIIIPYSITLIGYGAFFSCTNLLDIYILRNSLNGMITGSLFMFMYTPTLMRIHFPDQMTVNEYKVANYWSSYASKMVIGSPES